MPCRRQSGAPLSQLSHVSPGQLLLTIVPLDQMYVTANCKETQLAHIWPGQRAVIRTDTYGRQLFDKGAPQSAVVLRPGMNVKATIYVQ
jgi:hypothetical protein